MQKTGKYISTFLIIAITIIGIILAFRTHEAKYSFYFFGVSVILTIAFSIIILLGNISKNNSIVQSISNAIEKGLDQPNALETIASIFRKQPYYQSMPSIMPFAAPGTPANQTPVPPTALTPPR